MNTSFGKALIIFLGMDLFILFLSMGMTHLGGTSIYSLGDNGIISDFDNGGVLKTFNVSSLPSSESVQSDQNNNWYTDLFKTSKQWLLDATGLSYVVKVLAGPASVMTLVGINNEVVVAIGGFWMALTAFLLISWLFGKGD